MIAVAAVRTDLTGNDHICAWLGSADDHLVGLSGPENYLGG